jgi:flagellar hook-basal body complex protein FliE
MSPITAITAIPLTAPTSSIASTPGQGTGGFGSALKSAIQNVDGYQQDANQAINQFLQGNGELHNVALVTQRAEMAFDLAVQIRNKVISAYQEVMKMQL